MEKLRRYYEYDFPKLKALSSTVSSDTKSPCYSLYHDLEDSVECHIRYSSQPMLDKLIFFGELDGTKVCHLTTAPPCAYEADQGF
jgi:hypothetical protein